MDGLQQVTFHFGRDSEVRYLTDVPEAGDRFTHGDALWVVSLVDGDSIGSIVTCELPAGDRSRRRPPGFAVTLPTPTA